MLYKNYPRRKHEAADFRAGRTVEWSLFDFFHDISRENFPAHAVFQVSTKNLLQIGELFAIT